MISSKLSALFEPQSIAVIGVGRSVEGVGRQVFENIRRGGYEGRLYGVNPKLAELGEWRMYPDIRAVPEPVDLAVIAVPAVQVPAVIAQCGERAVRAAIVISAGFAETGAAGAALQARAVDEARRHGLRLLGPNCLGMMRAPVALNASFCRGISRPGKLALVSQSGAICSAVVDWAEARQIGFSTVVSLGASADIGAGDVLDYLALDPSTDAILLYLEGVDHARSFMSGLRAAARLKPVIVVKAGRHAASSRAAVSHTGAIVGNDLVFDAAVRRAGAIRVATLHELFSAAEALSNAPRAQGDRLAVITNAGGLGVLAVDRAEDLGVTMATLGADTRAQLDRLLPSHAARDNPIDILGDATPDAFRASLDICLQDPHVDGVVVLLSPQTMTRPDEVATTIAACERAASKPIMACFMGGSQVQRARETLVQQQVSCFDSPEAAVEAFATLARFRRHQQLLLQLPEARSTGYTPDVTAARAVIAGALDAGRTTLSQLESQAVLQAFGIPCVRSLRACTLDEAVAAATTLGFPVALKIDSPDIARRTEVDGVRLQIADEAELRAAHRDLLEAVRQHAPTARVEGVVVESMLTPHESRELLVGVSHDRALGPAIAFGAGGTLVELLSGAAVELPPLNGLLASDMLTRARVAPWLGPFRGMQPVDRQAVERVLLRVSDLVCELPEVKELDINPLLADARGAIALDARIVVERRPREAPPYAHLAISPFPRHLVRKLALDDGATITMRPIHPEDAALEIALLRDLSFESKHARFLGGLGRLTPEMLVRLTQLDYDREMAFVATEQRGELERPLGIARYVADPDGQGCEFAIVVTDTWQRRGLGWRLMTALMETARSAGIRCMHGEVFAANVPMLSLATRLGFTVEPSPADAGLRLVKRALRWMDDAMAVLWLDDGTPVALAERLSTRGALVHSRSACALAERLHRRPAK